MDVMYGLPLLAGLAYSLHVVRRIALRDKRKAYFLRRATGGHQRMRFRKPARSPRSEMRAYDNPTTVAAEIRTTTASPAIGNADAPR
jgi:hypothetical protein